MILFILLFQIINNTAPSGNILLKTISNKDIYFTTNKSDKATVIVFLSPQCPLCQSYSLTINNLVKQHKNNGIRFIAVVPGSDYTTDEIVAFKKKYKFTDVAFFIDPNKQLTKKISATITPEVFVINNANKIVYSGRIDNWAYALGKKRAVITEHNLATVLKQIATNKSLTYTKTQAIGCFIE